MAASMYVYMCSSVYVPKKQESKQIQPDPLLLAGLALTPSLMHPGPEGKFIEHLFGAIPGSWDTAVTKDPWSFLLALETENNKHGKSLTQYGRRFLRTVERRKRQAGEMN